MLRVCYPCKHLSWRFTRQCHLSKHAIYYIWKINTVLWTHWNIIYRKTYCKKIWDHPDNLLLLQINNFWYNDTILFWSRTWLGKIKIRKGILDIACHSLFHIKIMEAHWLRHSLLPAAQYLKTNTRNFNIFSTIFT